MALGASAGRVRRNIMSQTIGLVSIGLAIGLVGGFVVARLMASLLYRLQPLDAVTFAASMGLMFAVALAAGYVPALRASRVDPSSALRSS